VDRIKDMALITITGYPSSGKSRRAQQLKEYLESKLADPEYHGPTLKVVVLSDDDLNLSRSVYDGIHPDIFSGCPRSDSASRQPFRKTCPRDTVLLHAETDRTGHHPGHRFAQLCQRLQISDVLCCEGNEDKGLHSKWVASAFREALKFLDEVGLCRGQTRAMSRMEFKPRGRGYEVLGRNVCSQCRLHLAFSRLTPV